mgnify:CR=1 FL=1
MALIKCENVSIGYEGQMVVHDLNFEINQGDYLCIVGENGSGKSTLVKSLLGLKNVDKGKIVFDDGLKQDRDRISSTADRCEERFSGQCL